MDTHTNNQHHKSWNIEIKNLTAGYPNQRIFENLNATLPGREVSALLGSSGCGKSTLLKIILRLIPTESGQIFIGNHDILAMPFDKFRKLRRRFGVLFQDGALLGSMNLIENVSLPLTENTDLSSKIRTDAAMRVLELVGLKDYATYYPSQLSGGMKKRAGLARAIITEPPLLFCDEPTSGLDPITSAQMDQLLLDMKAYYPGMTIILITHDLASVQSIAQHILLLSNGNNLYNGTKEDLYKETNEYTQQFLARKATEEKRMTSPVDSQVRAALDSWFNH